jgi:hypothetical protein
MSAKARPSCVAPHVEVEAPPLLATSDESWRPFPLPSLRAIDSSCRLSAGKLQVGDRTATNENTLADYIQRYPVEKTRRCRKIWLVLLLSLSAQKLQEPLEPLGDHDGDLDLHLVNA